MKRTIDQSVFNSKDARRVAKQATLEANREIEAKHVAGVFSEGDPNHPRFNNGINYVTGAPMTLFGYETRAFMSRQHRK